MPRFNREGARMGERAGVERRRGEGKEKVEGMTEGRGRKEGMGNSDGWGIAPLLLGRIDATGCCRKEVTATRPSVRPSVCLSHAGIVSKRLNLS